MNRRNFLRSGGLAMIAVAGLPKAVKAMRTKDATIYRTKMNTSLTEQWAYEIAIDHYGVENFGSASDEEKKLVLKVAHFEQSDFTTPTQTGEYSYKITGAKKAGDGDTAVWTISTKFDKKVSGEHKFEKDFPKNPKLLFTKYKSIDILGKDNKTSIQSLAYPEPGSSTGSGTGGCFLTTACVLHKGLADDCVELQTLRSLRDHFMLPNVEGKTMVEQYYRSGPALVEAIDACDNKTEIYEYMYSHMILPSVELVSAGRYDEAVQYYQTFVKALNDRYN